ncbi:UDP-N-acetylmuramoyl-tripeptide--D-alanyl-D-alanine ligase [Candidatus Gottesmanbacteria bacterium]|nr:UDP-N-acetylmuramoyl-tripeptide--D-alanyl-D-alanine ligase [Candidatus Gottesmanbacteria bacterium]
MKILVIFIATIWFVRLLFNLLSYIHLWFIKEYRWDRMWIHLHTRQGKRILFPARRIPQLTPKTVVLFLSTLLVCGALFVLLPLHPLFSLVVIDIVLFPITAGLVFFMKLPTMIYHEYKISQAVSRLRLHKKMMVIGVTGSFGKTSTKENIATILSTKYKVLKTEASKNSPIGIAETILEKLLVPYDVFVVEMGAYKKGEITRMALMVKPEIGIATGINAQHQDLFGTIETTVEAKYELIAGLVGRRIAIVNADNQHTRQMMQWAKRDGVSVWAYTKEKQNLEADKVFSAANIQADLKGISFDVTVGKERAHVVAPVLGEHQVSNILAAIAGAVAAGMSLASAAKAAHEIQPFTKTLSLIRGINGSIYINDTFNNNPDAAKAALDVLAMANGRKILVFQPMIELGSYTQVSHQEVGKAAARVCDDIILTNANFSEHFIDGVHSVNPKKNVSILTPIETARFIRETVKKDDAVLFKGKEAEFAFKLLT